MLHALTYSIIKHLETEIPELKDVVWMFDGVKLTGRVKPFVTVEQMPESSLLLSAGRTDYEETYRYQIGLFTKSGSERTRFSEVVKSKLRQKNIPFIDTSTNPPTIVGFFVCDVMAVTPMPVDELASETNKHRVYFDVEVSIYRANGETTFTQ